MSLHEEGASTTAMLPTMTVRGTREYKRYLTEIQELATKSAPGVCVMRYIAEANVSAGTKMLEVKADANDKTLTVPWVPSAQSALSLGFIDANGDIVSDHYTPIAVVKRAFTLTVKRDITSRLPAPTAVRCATHPSHMATGHCDSCHRAVCAMCSKSVVRDRALGGKAGWKQHFLINQNLECTRCEQKNDDDACSLCVVM